MPTDLMRTGTPPTAPRSSARNASIVAIALTAALVVLQLVGLAMLERSHALPVLPSLVNSSETAICAEQIDVHATQTPYD